MWLALHTTKGNPIVVNMDLVISVEPTPGGTGAMLRALLLVGPAPGTADLHSINVRETVDAVSRAVKATKPK
jgi:hypothetical protein